MPSLKETRNLWSVILLSVGIITVLLWADLPTITEIFALMYMIKLILCFAGDILEKGFFSFSSG